jgi:hypothetical protein
MSPKVCFTDKAKNARTNPSNRKITNSTNHNPFKAGTPASIVFDGLTETNAAGVRSQGKLCSTVFNPNPS